MPKLLNLIAVKWENGTDREPPFMMAYPSAIDAAGDEEELVGVYKLVSKLKVKKVVQTRPVK